MHAPPALAPKINKDNTCSLLSVRRFVIFIMHFEFEDRNVKLILLSVINLDLGT